jgi:hypothetical protein
MVSPSDRAVVSLLDSADAIDNGGNESYLDSACAAVDVIITMQYAQASRDDHSRSGRMEATEAVEFPQPDVNTEVLQSMAELGKLALAITLVGSYPFVHARTIANDGNNSFSSVGLDVSALRP